MTSRVSIKQKRLEAPRWIYDWRKSGRYVLRSSFATLITAGVFAFFFIALRVRVVRPVIWQAPQASLIHVDDSASGRMLVQRAREEGPFPSRFSPMDEEVASVLEGKLDEATRSVPEPYVPALRGFSDVATPYNGLAIRGEPVLPTRPLALAQQPEVRKLVMVPQLSPISGIGANDLPPELPELKLEVGDPLALQNWHFLIRLDARGRVRDCLPMAGGVVLKPTAIEQWLRQIAFRESPGVAERWIALAVGFKNQALNHGPDTD